MPDPTAHFQTARLHLVVGGDPDAVIVSLSGELDIATVSVLTTALQAAMTADAGPIVIDASAVTFVDAAGLHAILTPLDGDASAAVRVRKPSAPVRRLLTILDRTDVIEWPEVTTQLSGLGGHEVGDGDGSRRRALHADQP